MIISSNLFRKLGACEGQIEMFEKTFPSGGMAIMGETLRRAHEAHVDVGLILDGLCPEPHGFADFATRGAAPVALRHVGLTEQAEILENLSPIVDTPTAQAAQEALASVLALVSEAASKAEKATLSAFWSSIESSGHPLSEEVAQLSERSIALAETKNCVEAAYHAASAAEGYSPAQSAAWVTVWATAKAAEVAGEEAVSVWNALADCVWAELNKSKNFSSN